MTRAIQHAGLKIPGGANILFSSPLAKKVSNYNTNRWMLSSGGDEPIKHFAEGMFYKNLNSRAVLANNDQSKVYDQSLAQQG